MSLPMSSAWHDVLLFHDVYSLVHQQKPEELYGHLQMSQLRLGGNH